MRRREVLDLVVTPDGRELVLERRGDLYTILVDGEELMASRASGSERSLAELALGALGARPAPRVLIGGLGMGFTLRAALDALAGRPRATLVVAELFAEIVAWNRGPLAPLAGRPLADPRARVEVADVADLLAARAPWDAVLLDVDNGPDAFTVDRNARLYGRAGLARLHTAVAPGGVLAVWSAADDPRFATRLAAAGFAPTTHRVPARTTGQGGKHVIFLARRP
ncbi:MAG TPA: spermidine synthase [Thermoanaerobaculia bacterium]|nr:spermidine synthase [Thermoanaerobaculia bacterium]